MGLTILEKVPPVLDPLPGGKQMVDGVDYIINWARRNSLWPLVYGTSCCAIEMMSVGGSHHDWSRFGVEVVRATPRQADLIILAGTVVEKMASRLKILYDQMPAPKYVIAMGACTISGGPFMYDNYSVCKGTDSIIPVDVYIPGCPPRPEALLQGIMELQECIKKESLRTPRNPQPLPVVPHVDPWLKANAEWELEEAGRKEKQDAEIAAFKEKNPDFKAAKIPRKQVEKLEVLAHTPKPSQGLCAVDIHTQIAKKFPKIVVFDLEVAEDSTVADALSAKTSDYVLDIHVSAEQYLPLITFLKKEESLQFDFLSFLSVVDYENHFDIVVHLMSTISGHLITVRRSIEDRENPSIETLSTLYAGANWHEREVYDMFGITFDGHPDMRRIFLNELADEFVGFPLRKDWKDTVEGRYIPKPY